ncbi:hypothetical protein MTY414_44290 [Mycolicibacterium mageritense]|nr:hypothetical protein MTY414_44290 [Mycolicibacterium mageritense]
MVFVNGLSGTRRLASPVRLTLAERLGAGIDGAWWPHSDSLAHELPELVSILHRPLGKIVDIRVNWSNADAQLDLDTIATGNRWAIGTQTRRPRLMVVAGPSQCVKLLVLPCKTSQSLGGMVMRRAAAMPITDEVRHSPLLEAADGVLRVAQVESTRWLGTVSSTGASEV